jgi:hypothetical protein
MLGLQNKLGFRWVLGLSAAAGLVATAGFVGCSSDNTSTPPPAVDSGSDVATGDDGPAATDDGPVMEAGPPCVQPASGLTIVNIDAGAGSSWACLQGKCASQMTACAADCLCNTTVLGGLACAVDAGTYSAQNSCLTNAITPIYTAGNVPSMGLGMCLLSNGTACAPSTDGGDGGDAGDGSTEAGDADAGDGATSDAPADAPADGG